MAPTGIESRSPLARSGRMGSNPGHRYAPLVMGAGKYLTDALIKASASR